MMRKENDASEDTSFLVYLSAYSRLNFFQRGAAQRHTTSPAAEMIIHVRIVAFQPLFSAIAAKPYVATDAPMYVQALSIPEYVATLPLLRNLFGTTEMSMRLIPCIHAMITAMRIRETAADEV